MCNTEPANGYATFMLVAPWQYATINPAPVAKDATARIKGRSGLISNSSLVRRIFLLTLASRSCRFWRSNPPARRYGWILEMPDPIERLGAGKHPWAHAGAALRWKICSRYNQ